MWLYSTWAYNIKKSNCPRARLTSPRKRTDPDAFNHREQWRAFLLQTRFLHKEWWFNGIVRSRNIIGLEVYRLALDYSNRGNPRIWHRYGRLWLLGTQSRSDTCVRTWVSCRRSQALQCLHSVDHSSKGYHVKSLALLERTHEPSQTSWQKERRDLCKLCLIGANSKLAE